MHKLWGFRARCRSLWGVREAGRPTMGSRRVQGVALLAGLLRAINKRCCQHPPLDPRLFSSSPPLSLYICVYICIYIFFCLFSSRSFFSYFFHFTLFFSPLILSRSFFPHTCLFSRKFIVSLSLSFSPAVWNSFQSINSFPKSIVFFLSFLFFIRNLLFFISLKGIIFPLSSRTWLLWFSSRSILRSEWFLRLLL